MQIILFESNGTTSPDLATDKIDTPDRVPCCFLSETTGRKAIIKTCPGSDVN